MSEPQSGEEVYSQRGFEASIHHANEVELIFGAFPCDIGRVWATGAIHGFRRNLIPTIERSNDLAL